MGQVYGSDISNFDAISCERLYVNGGLFPEMYRRTYYVEANAGLDTNDGSSWEKAFKTLTVAMAASHANIALDSLGWAARNRILYKGDNAEASAETLTTLAQKTDIVGVGSYDHNPGPKLVGNHLIVGSYMGCRFINMGFMSLAAGGAIFTAPTTVSGLAFINCFFDGRTATAATKAIVTAGCEQFSIIGCKFIGKFSTATIDIGTGSGRLMVIKDNEIESGAIGIAVNSGYTCADAMGLIINNVINAVTLTIDENSDTVSIGGNRGGTEADGTVAASLDYNDNLAYDNVFYHSAGVSQYPVLVTIPT